SRRTALVDLGLAVVALGEAPSDGVVVDDTGAYRAWLDQLQADAVLIRPDFAVYGTARGGEDVPDLVDGLLSALGHPAPATAGAAAPRQERACWGFRSSRAVSSSSASSRAAPRPRWRRWGRSPRSRSPYSRPAPCGGRAGRRTGCGSRWRVWSTSS